MPDARTRILSRLRAAPPSPAPDLPDWAAPVYEPAARQSLGAVRVLDQHVVAALSHPCLICECHRRQVRRGEDDRHRCLAHRERAKALR